MENVKLREIFYVSQRYILLGFSIVTLMSKMVHVM